jgi:hypothetical protein
VGLAIPPGAPGHAGVSTRVRCWRYVRSAWMSSAGWVPSAAGARPAWHPHRAEQFARLEAGLEEPGKEVGGGGQPGLSWA